jgi:acyl carrier protein
MAEVNVSDDVFAAVRDAIAESVAIPAARVTPESSLVDDLGADSLDFIEIVFMLERRLGISVRDTEFNFLSRLDFSSPDVMKDGYLSATVVEQLSRWLPRIAAAPDKTRISGRDLFSMITVEAICRVLQRQLDERGPASRPAPDPG